MTDKVVVTGYKDMCFNVKEGKEDKEVDMLKVTLLSKNNGQDAVGFLPMQLTYLDKKKKDISKQITIVPGLYGAEYGMVPGKNNKPSLEIVGFTLIRPLDEFQDLFEA